MLRFKDRRSQQVVHGLVMLGIAFGSVGITGCTFDSAALDGKNGCRTTEGCPPGSICACGTCVAPSESDAACGTTSDTGSDLFDNADSSDNLSPSDVEPEEISSNGTPDTTQDTSTVRDDDNDGVANEDDNCPSVANTDQRDLDNDGMGDLCDDDRDGDGSANTDDNCPDLASGNQLDIDSDGVGDECDTDDDGDSVSDTLDNCPTLTNTDQSDADSDGVGDVCDNCSNTSNPTQLDSDFNAIGDVCQDTDLDTILDSDDNCVGVANLDQDDSDADGIGTVCDVCPELPDPEQIDSDNDGFGDLCDGDLSGGLVVCYDFTTQAVETTGTGLDGVSEAIDFTQDADKGPVAEFGENGYIDIRSDTDARDVLPTRAITVAAWVKVSSAHEWGGYFGYIKDNGPMEQGWALGNRNTKFSFALSSRDGRGITYLTDPTTFSYNRWYHVAGSYDGTHLRLYVDGQMVTETQDQSGDIDYPRSGWWTIGRYKDSNEDFRLDGRLDDVILWERTLTAQEIQILASGAWQCSETSQR